MKCFNGIGARWAWSNSGAAIAAGDVVVIKSGGAAGGVNLGVAVDAIPANSTGVVQIGGDMTLPALTTDTGSPGDALYWDAANTRLTTTASGNTWAGVFIAAKINGDTTARILLNALPFYG